MNPRTVIIAFLAARYPAAYTDASVTERVNRCGLLDKPVALAEVQAELRLLAQPRFGLVSLDADPTTGCVVWSATTAGVARWHLDGQTHVA